MFNLKLICAHLSSSSSSFHLMIDELKLNKREKDREREKERGAFYILFPFVNFSARLINLLSEINIYNIKINLYIKIRKEEEREREQANKQTNKHQNCCDDALRV
jgi:hypothetical protein